MTYEIEVVGEEVDFEPIEATDIHAAARQTRELLANKNVWASETQPFTSTVVIRATTGEATVTMPVECATR